MTKDDLISRQPETHEERTETHACDLISRQAAIDALADMHCKSDEDGYVWIIRSDAWARIDALPSAQPETPPYVAEIESEYKKWASMPHINKPLAKALYEVWKKHDREDVSRNG